MSNRFLGKVAAGTAAVAGAFLLVAAPGVAQAATPPDGRHDKGCIITYPKVVKPGHEVKIIAKCKKPQDKPWAWSEVTGKVWLKPWYPPKPEHTPTREPLARPDGMSDESWAGDADGHVSDGYGRGHKDGIDPMAPESQWSGDKKADDYGRGHKDGIDPRKPVDSQWFGDKKQDDKTDGYGRGHKDGIDPMAPAPESQSYGDKKAEDQADGEGDAMVDGKIDGHRTFVYVGKAEVYRHAKPGKYWIKGSCGFGRLIVAPKGWVDGGDGGSTGSNTGLAAGGATALAAAAVGGVALVRRRKADGSLA